MRHAVPAERSKKMTLSGHLARLLVLLCFLSLIAGTHAERLPIKIYTSADGLGSSAALSIVRDARGFIWLCSRDGLVRFDGYRFITYRIGDADADAAVADLLPTREGTYWIDLNRGTDYRFIHRDETVPLEPLGQLVAKNDSRVPLNVEPVDGVPLPTFEDSAGNLWATDDKGIYLVHETDGRPVAQPVELRLPGNPAGSTIWPLFYEGRDGSLWIGTARGLVRRLPDGKQIYYNLRPENTALRILSIAEDKAGRIWLSRYDNLFVLKPAPLSELGALDQFNAPTVVSQSGSVDASGETQLPEQANEVVAFKPTDILLRDSGKNAEEEAAPDPRFYGLLSASDGRIWITNTRGLVIFDGKRFQRFSSQQGIGQSLIDYKGIVEDNEGNIWLPSYSGLLRLNPKGLVSFDEADGLTQTRVHSIYEDHDGELNVVAGDWNISRLSDGGFKGGRPLLPGGGELPWQSNVALLDSHGDWWVATTQKVFRYSGVRRAEELAGRQPSAVYSASDGLVSDRAYHIFEDSRGDIWISTFPDAKQFGLTRWERSTGKFYAYLKKDGLPETACASSFAEDAAGNLWFGFNDGIMARYRAGHFTTFGKEDGVPQGTITSLYTDRSGRLWITSSGSGLARLEDPAAERPSFKHYTIADGLTSNNIRCLTEDLFGNIYVGTVRGVNRLSPETGRIKYYGTGDGLASDFVSAAYRDRTGVIWFGTFSGLSKLVPEPDAPSRPPPILIAGLRIAGEDYPVSPLGQAAVFVPDRSASQNNVQIDFFSIGAGSSDSTGYQYKLEGVDKDWSPLTSSRSVTFANLSPAAYRFLVRAVNGDGVVSEQAASVSFRVLRPIWQRWWFLALAGLLLISLAYLLYRYRVAQLLRVERVRTRIASDLHDDIGASLSRVAILSEIVKLQTEGAGNGGHNQSAPLLTEIADSARGLVDSMSDIVWSIDPRRDDLHQVVVRVRQFASDVLEARGIEWDFQVAPEVEKLKLDPEQRRHLYLIFKEGLNNVVRHAGEVSQVLLSIELVGHQLVGEIRDDGQGFVPKPAGERQSNGRGGNGLPNMRARAEQVGGRLEVESAPGAGTRLRLQLPLK